MIAGLILLGMTSGTVLGATALIAGSSLAVAITIYALAGSFSIIGVIAVLALRNALSATRHAEQMTTQHMNSAQP